FVEQYGLSPYHAGQLIQSRALADYFEATVKAGAAAQSANNWVTGALASKLNEIGVDVTASPLDPERLAALTIAIDSGAISGPIGKEVFEKMFSSGRTA